MNKKYIKKQKCIWCGKSTSETTFKTRPHIIPDSLGGEEIGFDVCDECNHAFGTTKQPGKPCVDLCVKEVFNAFRVFGSNLNETSYKKLKSIFFEYRHSKHSILIRKGFNSHAITRQFKRGLYEIFLQKYHFVTQNGDHPMFDVIRKFARYDIGDLNVYYLFNNILLVPENTEHPQLPMSEPILEDMMNYGVFSFSLVGHCFFLEIFPTVFVSKGRVFLQQQANKFLIPAVGNEKIIRVSDIMQIDFLMNRFSN